MSIQEILHQPLEQKYNPQRRLKLICLANSIPKGHKTTLFMNLFLEFALNIDYIDMKKFTRDREKAIKTNFKAIMDEFTNQFDISENAEPIEKFLRKAIVKGKNWEQLIKEHQINLLFPINYRLWTVRDIWLLFLCMNAFEKKEGYVLAFKLLNRSRLSMELFYKKARNSLQLQTKLNYWLTKTKQQLEEVYDDDQRNLLIAIVSHISYAQALNMQCFTRLNFKTQAKNEMHALWIPYLSYKFHDNMHREYPQVHWSKNAVKWKTIISFWERNSNIQQQFQFRLQDILQKYESFDKHFTDEVEVILLTGLKQQISWLEIKSKINELFIHVHKEKDGVWSPLVKYRQQLSLQNEQEDNTQSQNTQNYKRSHFGSRISSRQYFISNQEPENININNSQDQIEYQQYQSAYYKQKKAKNSNIKPAIFDLNEQQELVLSLLEKGRQNLKNVQVDVAKTLMNLHHQPLSCQSFIQQNEKISSSKDKTYNQSQTFNLENSIIPSIQIVNISRDDQPTPINDKTEIIDRKNQKLNSSERFSESDHQIMQQLKIINPDQSRWCKRR